MCFSKFKNCEETCVSHFGFPSHFSFVNLFLYANAPGSNAWPKEWLGGYDGLRRGALRSSFELEGAQVGKPGETGE